MTGCNVCQLCAPASAGASSARFDPCGIERLRAAVRPCGRWRDRNQRFLARYGLVRPAGPRAHCASRRCSVAQRRKQHRGRPCGGRVETQGPSVRHRTDRKPERAPAAMRPSGRVSEDFARRMACGKQKTPLRGASEKQITQLAPSDSARPAWRCRARGRRG